MKIEKRIRTNNVITVNVTLTTKIQKLYAAKSRINDTAHVSGSPLPMTFWKDRCTGQDRVHKKKKATKLLILIARIVMILFFTLQQNMISGQHVIFLLYFMPNFNAFHIRILSTYLLITNRENKNLDLHCHLTQCAEKGFSPQYLTNI